MLQVTLGVYVSGSKNSICKDSDSIKLEFGILLQCGVFCGLGYPVRPAYSRGCKIVEPVVLLVHNENENHSESMKKCHACLLDLKTG